MAENNGPNMMTCPRRVIDETLHLLQEYGRRRCECVVLWLGQRTSSGVEVIEAYRPRQIVRSHMFRITEEGMDELRAHLRATRLMVAAQVHTHPEEAFHSEADDRWAIVRHAGALSLVLPFFAAQTDTSRFHIDVKVFRLAPTDEWLEVPNSETPECLIIR